MATGGTTYSLTVSFDAPAVPMLPILINGLRIQGLADAPRAEIRRMLKFAVDHKIELTIMIWPLDEQGITDAMKTLREGKMRYRGVLVAA